MLLIPAIQNNVYPCIIFLMESCVAYHVTESIDTFQRVDNKHVLQDTITRDVRLLLDFFLGELLNAMFKRKCLMPTSSASCEKKGTTKRKEMKWNEMKWNENSPRNLQQKSHYESDHPKFDSNSAKEGGKWHVIERNK